MSVPQTITAVVAMPVTLVIPRAIAPGVDEQTADFAAAAFAARANRPGRCEYTAEATIAAFIRAALDGTAVTVLYEHDDEATARTLFPNEVRLTADDRVVARAYCTYRNETRTFRCDRMSCVQHVTLPGEVAA